MSIAGLSDLFGMVARSVLVRRSSVMLTGVITAKIASVLSLLLLARLYSTEAFGLLGLFQAVVLVVSVVAALGYQGAIALPERDDDAASLLFVCLAFLCVSAILTTIAVAVFGHSLGQWLDSPALAGLFWWAPVFLLGLGAYESLNYWSTRRQAFRRLAGSSVLLAAMVAAIQVGAFFHGAAMGGLIAGAVLGTGAAGLALGLQTWRTDSRILLSGLSWPKIRALASIYRKFPIYQAPAALLNAGSAALVPLGLGVYFGPVVVGYFWIADRVCGYLTNVVRQSFQNIFLSRAAEVANAGGNVARLFHRTTLGLLWLALPLTTLFILSGPLVFRVAFGSEWVEAGVFARWLAPAWLFTLLNIPAAQLAAIYHRQQWIFLYTIVLAAFRAGAITAGAIAANPMLVLVIYAAGSGVCSVALILGMSRELVRRPLPSGPPAALHL